MLFSQRQRAAGRTAVGIAATSALLLAPLVSVRAQDTVPMDTSASQAYVTTFKTSFNVDTSLSDLKFIRKKGRDDANFSYFKLLLDGFENKRLDLDKVDAIRIGSVIANPGTKILKMIDIRFRDTASGGFSAQLDVELDEKGRTNVAVVSHGANGRDDRLNVSEVILPKKCKILRCDPFFIRDTRYVAEIGAYIKYKDKRDGRKYQLMMKVMYSKMQIGVVKTTVAFMRMNDNEMGTVSYINGQPSPQ